MGMLPIPCCLSAMVSHRCPVFINFLKSLLSYTPNGHAAHTLLLVGNGVSPVSGFYQFSAKPSIVHYKIAYQQWCLTGVQFLSIFCKAFYRTLQNCLSASLSDRCPGGLRRHTLRSDFFIKINRDKIKKFSLQVNKLGS